MSTVPGNPLKTEDSITELLGGIANLQYNYKPVMPDLYLPFRELEQITREDANCEIVRRKERREQRKQPRLPKVKHVVIAPSASTPGSQGFSIVQR